VYGDQRQTITNDHQVFLLTIFIANIGSHYVRWSFGHQVKQVGFLQVPWFPHTQT